MSEKRRDSKNRILRTGESQEADGRYKYRYIDANGKRKSVYSWRLVATDSVPYGKKDNAPLRDQEKLINRDLDDMIVPDGCGLTVSQLVSKYIATKTSVKHTTRAGYGTVMNLLEKDPFGDRRIDKVRLSDAKEWLIKLQQVDKNEAHYCKYYDGMYILFKTGMRISEFTGLTLKDLDMENRTINIDHQLQKTGTLVYIDTTKTYAGTRVIPMQDDVYECFQNIIKARPKLKVEPMIDGYSGFLCFDKDGKPMVAMHWEKYFQHAVQKYNRIYRIQLPKITPHVCRHTYCSNMAKSGMNPKVLQYLMGHSDISVTLNTYTHLKLDDAIEEVEKLARMQAEADAELKQLGMKVDATDRFRKSV